MLLCSVSKHVLDLTHPSQLLLQSLAHLLQLVLLDEKDGSDLEK